jgi:hypothetical protein
MPKGVLVGKPEEKRWFKRLQQEQKNIIMNLK